MTESIDLHNSTVESQDQFEPFIGPRSFRKNIEDRLRFFGRDSETDEIVSLITTHTLVLVYAQSGAGKTSIFNAQVIPTLEGYGFKPLPVARVHVTSSSTVTTSHSELVNPPKIKNIYIFNALQSLRQDGNSHSEDDINSHSDANLSLFEFLDEHFRNHRDESGNLHPQVLIFDQLEELFTIYPDVEQQKDFFEQVADSLENNPLLKIVFIIREDYLAQLDPFKGMLPEKLRPSFRLEPLRHNEAILAGTGPLKRILEGHDRDEIMEIEHELKELVEDLLKIYVELPGGGLRQIPGEFIEPIHFQVVLRRWWNSRTSTRSSGSKEGRLEDLANVNKALEEFYEKAILVASDTSKVGVGRIRNWCQEKLITSSGTRSIVHRDRNLTEGMDNRVVDILKNENLIRREWRSGGQWYELTHDRMIKPVSDSNARWRNESNKKKKKRILKVMVPALALSVILLSQFVFVPVLFPPVPTPAVGSVGNTPAAVSVNPENDMAYVLNFGSNSISIINGTTNSVIEDITVGSGPTGISINPNSNIMYVTNQFSDTVSVIDGTTNNIQAEIPVGSGPTGISINPNSNLVYVINSVDDTISVINGTTNSVIKHMPVGSGPIGISINPNTNIAYVTNQFSGTVSVIDGTTNSVIENITVGSGPTGISINPNTNIAYVANAGNSVSVVNGTTFTVIADIPVGYTPVDVSFNPYTNIAYVANYASDTVSVIDGTTNSVSQL